MIELAILLRGMQFYTHNAHNLCKGSLFFPDHDYLGKLYPLYEEAYDGVVERCIGLKMPVDLILVQQKAVEMLSMYEPQTKDNKSYFQNILEMEKSICSLVESYILNKDMSEGTRQMLGTLCDESEMRQYQLGQRVK